VQEKQHHSIVIVVMVMTVVFIVTVSVNVTSIIGLFSGTRVKSINDTV